MEIDEEPLSPGIVLVEEFVIAGFIGFDGIGAVHRLVGIESGGEVLYIIEAKKKSENDNHSETKKHRRNAACAGRHSICFSFLVLKL